MFKDSLFKVKSIMVLIFKFNILKVLEFNLLLTIKL